MIKRLLVLTVLLLSNVCFSQTETPAASEATKPVAEQAVTQSQSADSGTDNTTVPTAPPKSSSNELVIQAPSNAQSAVNQLSNSNRPSGIVTTNPMSAFMGLLFLLAIIGVGIWIVKRTGGGNFLQSQNIKIVSALSLGVREKIVLVDIGDKQILLGVAPGRISHLQSFDEPVVEQAEQNDFSSKLKLLLNKQGGRG